MKTDNELIAEFMGSKPYEDGRYGTMWPDPTNGNRVGFGLKYDTSWDWLMPVVEKICKSKTFIPWFSNEPHGVKISIHPNACSIDLPDPSEGFDYVDGCYEAPSQFCYNVVCKETIECVYECCVAYIKWYNEQSGNKA